MAQMKQSEPQTASDYGDRTTKAVKSVLMEIGQILGSFHGKFVVIGGAVPWLLLDNEEMPHVGTLDIDLGLDSEALGDGEYTRLVHLLTRNGYQQRSDLQRFQLGREVIDDHGISITVIIDFLMPRDCELIKNHPPLISNFAVQKADGADLALKFFQTVALNGEMPGGGTNRIEIAVCSIPALLAMKGHAIKRRHKQKDAYDIYYCIRNYPEAIEQLAQACRLLMNHRSAVRGYEYIAEKFDSVSGYGPTCVRNFVEESSILGDRSPDQWQQDAFGQVDAWLVALGLRTPFVASSHVGSLVLDTHPKMAATRSHDQ